VDLLKPSGEGIRTALGKLSTANSDVLFIGDSVTDVLGARDAEVRVAIVQGGESSLTSLVAAGLSYLWDAIEELEALYKGGEQIIEIT
jgi:phosphoglycolate phosphatase-like HAD superfamily hydrolase